MFSIFDLIKTNNMKTAKIFYQIGAWSFGIICGLGHLSFELFSPKSPEIGQLLSELIITLPGKETDIATITFGISLLMGLMLFAYGVLNLLTISKDKVDFLPSSKILLFNLAITSIALVLALQYLFIIPIFLIGVSVVSYLLSTIIYFNTYTQNKRKVLS